MFGVSKITEQDVMYKNSIQMKRLDNLLLTRLWLPNKYRTPLTISILGFEGEVIGLKLNVYNEYSVSEKASNLFLIPTNLMSAVNFTTKKVVLSDAIYWTRHSALHLYTTGVLQQLVNGVIRTDEMKQITFKQPSKWANKVGVLESLANPFRLL